MMSATPEMRIGALAPWFGGKRTLAPRIVAELGKHTQYFEPLCGSMAVLFAKEPCRQETVNDLHGDLINLARVVQSDELAPRFFDRLQWLLVHEDELARARHETVENCEPSEDVIDVPRALAFFCVSWMGRNGESGLGKCERASRIAVRWTPNGGDPATRFRSAIESVPAWWRRLQGVTILRRDGFEIIERIPDLEGTAVYCDPPYLEKSDSYLHDFEMRDGGLLPDDHERLADALNRFARTRVVVSYYAHPRLARLYPGPHWTIIDCARAKNLKAQTQRGETAGLAPEVLIVNGPSYTAGAGAGDK